MNLILENLSTTQRLILFLIVSAIVIFLGTLFTNRTQQVQKQTARVTIPTPTIIPATPTFAYKEVSTEEVLSESDTRAKKELLTSKLRGHHSGIVYESSNLRIEYLKSVDQFQATVLTEDTEFAKQEAISWLRSEGISPLGICYLPIKFYLSSELIYTLQNSDAYTPLPPDC